MEILIVAILITIAFIIGWMFGSSNSTELVIPDNSNDFDTDKDAWEGSFWEASAPKKLTANLELHYVDANQQHTIRSLQLRKFDNALEGGLMIGHCELRDAIRTFRCDRVNKCIDLDTGEVIIDLRKYLNDKYDQSTEKSSEIIAIDYIDVLKVIYFVAKADGQYSKAEKEVTAKYVGTLVNDDRITPTIVNDILKLIDIPTLQGFKRALGRVLASGEVNPELLEKCCQEIVGTQKTVHPSEQEALDYISKKIATKTKKASSKEE